MFRDLDATGEILRVRLDYDAAGTLDGDGGPGLAAAPGALDRDRPDMASALFDVAPGEGVTPVQPRIAAIRGRRTRAGRGVPRPSRRHGVRPRAHAAESDRSVGRVPVAPPPPPGPWPRPARPRRPRAAPDQARSEAPASWRGSASAAGDETLRVSVGLLETLMNLAGELVLSRNQLRAAHRRSGTSQSLNAADQRLNQVTSELQEAIMQTRMQPIGNVFGKFPRVVRDLAAHAEEGHPARHPGQGRRAGPKPHRRPVATH